MDLLDLLDLKGLIKQPDMQAQIKAEMGGSVMITGLTDSGGFFIFLSLATIFLL